MNEVLDMGARETDTRRNVERNYSVMSLIMIGTFLFAWTPYAVSVLYLTINGSTPKHLVTVSAVFAKTSSLYNPVIYCIFLEDFRNKCRNFFESTWKSVLVMFICACKHSQLYGSVRRKPHSHVEQDGGVSPQLETVVFFTRHNSRTSADV